MTRKYMLLSTLMTRIHIREQRIVVIAEAGAPVQAVVFEQQVVDDLRKMYLARQVRLLHYVGILNKEVTSEILDS